MDAGRGPSATHRSVSPRARCRRQPPARPRSWRVEVGVARGGEQPRMLVFQGGRPGVAPVFPFPSGLAGRRLGAQLTVTGKALAKQRGVSSPYCKRRRGAFPWPSPPATLPHVPASPTGEAGHSLRVPPPIHTHSGEENQPHRRALAHLPLPLNPPDPPAASNRCPRPLVRIPWSLPQQPCTPTAAAGMLRGPPAGPAALPARLAGVALPGACFGPSRSVAAAPCSRCWRLTPS